MAQVAQHQTLVKLFVGVATLALLLLSLYCLLVPNVLKVLWIHRDSIHSRTGTY